MARKAHLARLPDYEPVLLPPGYSWMTDVMAAEANPPNPAAESAPPVRLNSSLVFEMPKPEEWDMLGSDDKLHKKRGKLTIIP